MKKKMTDKHKLMAYVLTNDAELNANKSITQSEIAHIFGVSQSTIALSNKETALRLRNNQLQNELNQAKHDIQELQAIQELPLPDNLSDQYQHKW